MNVPAVAEAEPTALAVTGPKAALPAVAATEVRVPPARVPEISASGVPVSEVIADAADGERSIVAFLCRECAYSAADAAGNARTPLPPTIRTIMVPCTGRVSPLHLLAALAEGADGVYVAGCLEGQCHYRVGNFHALDRVAFVRSLLESVGVEPERAAMFTMSAADTPRFVATARGMDATISRLPRLPRS
ncbi:MAG: hydrogenase iron-sulfur subunit [Candidatus Dormibacteria bacterium]